METKSKLLSKHWNSPTWICWRGMVYRCYRKKQKEYPRYGARGIKVCSFLRKATENLIATIGTRPPGMTVDRINGAMHYSCGDCPECRWNGWLRNIRWATPLQQVLNRSVTLRVVLGSETLYVSDIIKMTGASGTAIRQRIKTDPDKVFGEYKPTNIKIDVGCGSFTRKEIFLRFGITQSTIRSRLKRGLYGADLISPPKGTGRHGKRI